MQDSERYDKHGIRILPHHNRRTHKLAKKIRKSKDYRQWQEQVFEKDGGQCVKCGSRAEITTHHKIGMYTILNEEKIRTLRECWNCQRLWDVENGMTLCDGCHKVEHNILED